MLRSTIGRLGYAALKAGVNIPELPFLQRFAEQAFLRNLLSTLRINCFLDVGANDGWYSKHLRMMGYTGYLFSFEPIRENYNVIARLAVDDPRWQVFNFALGSENTRKPFNVIRAGADTTVLSSFLKPTLDLPIQRTEHIDIKRLDTILGELLHHIAEPRIFLKVDTQGYDLEVVKGAKDHLQSIIGLQSEISVTPIYNSAPHYTQALDYYESLGFSLMNLSVVNRTPYQSIQEYDCVMARLDQMEF